MDYNDNDYEGQNLHLAGEETSKISSVLRPFALPKFDFDDSLHGHLRFDSLVENEVFLGIPSQEDNQWIEDFSRGGNGIEFNSSAAESCALPRHINVWSEATSSESVEMLLKAVGQEEMIPGENRIEESDPGDQLGSSTRQMEDNLRKDCEIHDVEYGNPSLSSSEAEGKFSSFNQSAGIEGIQPEYNTVQVQETNATSGNLNIDMMRTSDKQLETCGLVNESLANQVQETSPVLGTETDNTQNSSQNVALSVNVSEGIPDSVEEQEEGCNEDARRSGETAVETDNTERLLVHEVPSDIEAPKEEHADETRATNFGEASLMPRKGESVSRVDGCNEVAFLVERASDIQHGTVVFSSGTEVKHLSEGCGILHENLSVSLQAEGIKGLGTESSNVVPPAIYGNTEMKPVPVDQTPVKDKIVFGNKDICRGSNSPIEAKDAIFESSMLQEVLGNPSEKDDESNNADAPDPGNSTGSTFAGECCGEKSVTDDMIDAEDTSVVQKANIEDGVHVSPPLTAGSTKTCAEDIISMQLDAHENELDGSAYDKGEKKLPLDSSDVACNDNEKEVGSTLLGDEVKAETTTGSQPNSSAGDYPGDELLDCHEHIPPACDTENRGQSNEYESEAPEKPSTSLKESSELNELPPAVETENGTLLDSAAVETKTSDQSVSMVETSGVAMPDEACNLLSKEMEHSAKDLLVRNDDAEAAPTAEPMEVETEKEHGENSSTVPVTISVEIDKSKETAAPGTGGANLSQSEMNKQASPKSNNAEHIGEVLTTSKVSDINVLSKEEGSFTFDIRPLGGQSTGDSGKGLQSFPRIKACKISLTGEGSPSTSGISQTDSLIVKEIPHVSSSTPGVTSGLCSPSGGPRGPSERKARRGSSKSGKGSANKGNQVKESTPLRQTEKRDKSSQFFSPLGAGQLMTFESSVKPRGTVSIPTSSLPDLNTSAPSSAFFQQPFTDLQQVQLRAQIFVYGSLIQGASPDEACMVSAFDGGRNVWEPSWRACVQRLHGQKTQGNNTETPVHSRSGAKTPDQTSRQGFPQSEALTSIAGRASNKAVPSPAVNPMMSLSSPLWNISTPSTEALPPSSMARSAVIDYHAVSPLNPYQTPPIRNYVAHTTWPSQAPFPVPWVASSQSSAFNTSTNYPAFPTTEPVKLTPVKESSLPISSGTKHVSPIPATRAGTTTMFDGGPSLDMKKVKASTGRSVDAKTRKRKKSSGTDDVVQISATASLPDTVSAPIVANQLLSKGPAVEGLSQISLIAQNQADPMPKPVVSSHYSTSVAVATPSSFVPKGTTNQFFTVLSPSISSDHLKRGDLIIDKKALHIESFSKVEEAKLQAQEAAAHAAAAISQCEGLWSQLDQLRNSGLTADAESRLASAAVAIAAAASVAKAATAAAEIASSAAMQAKQMADEAVTKSVTVNPNEHDAILVSNSINVGNASPVSILKAGDLNNAPNIAISAAREAARKRIEAASAATRHAENLDAIVKAAELAAEAVSHAGKIVTMVDPFSLSELVEAGPNNYWKVSQLATVPASKPNDTSKDQSISSNAGRVPNVYVNQNQGPDKDMRASTDVVSPIQRELSRNIVDDHVIEEDNLIASVKHGKNSFKPQKDKKVYESAKTAGVVSDPDIESRSNSFTTSIKEGSYVEVLKDCGDLKKAWFSASVLSLKDGEATVCYTDLQSDEGSERLKEWISVEAKNGEAPKVRIPHPMTAVMFEGTKKRRRAAVKDYTWSVGDKVDAWVQDCWREGIIAEKNKKDATTLSVQFPAQGETLLVKVWHLRPTLIWSGGQWVEWCRSGKDGTNQGDTPGEKRPKLGNTSVEAKGKAKMAKNIDFVEIGRNEEPRLPLAANEKVFSIGSTREENKPNIVRAMRSGVEKKGSRVVFGVPKPGEKRKFMEINKQYVSDRSAKTNVPNDSVKLAKYLMPQGSGSRRLKNNSSLDLKEKQVAESRPKATRPGKPPSIPRRTVARTDESTSSRPNGQDAAESDHVLKDSISNDENESGEQNRAESGSSDNVKQTSGGTMVFSSQALPQKNRKKATSRITRFERLNQGKLAPASGKSAKNEANEKSISEVAEPRRSNRRIQPTSRLLEGLQSSLIIPKISSSSHDKSHRSQNKGATRGSSSRG